MPMRKGKEIMQPELVRILGRQFFVAFAALTPVLTTVPLCFGERANLPDSKGLDLSPLLEIESRTLPPVLRVGPNRHATLADYYWEANPELHERLLAARRVYEAETPVPFRGVTLIAGAAGIGKTFIKKDIASRQYPPEAVCKLDLRELYEDWQHQGWTEARADLAAGENSLSYSHAQRNLAGCRLTALLKEKSAAFYILDSLDEVHPDDQTALLREIEAFALRGARDFVHVVVIGRGDAFCDYWRQTDADSVPGNLALMMLRPPEFRTTGDLLVSSWNHHCFHYKLAWTRSGENIPFTLNDYRDWSAAEFPRDGRYRNASFLSNHSLDSGMQSMLESWATHEPTVRSVLPNLAGNGIIRTIAEDFYLRGARYDDREVMETYLHARLLRESAKQQRPCNTRPEFLKAYLQAFEEVAAKYLRERKVDADGYFYVAASDTVEVQYRGGPMTLPVNRILDRSGLECCDPRTKAGCHYRFEPVWFHRFFVNRYLERNGQGR